MTRVGANTAIVLFLLFTQASAYHGSRISITSSTYSYSECRAVNPYQFPGNSTNPIDGAYYIEADGAKTNKSLSEGSLRPETTIAESRNIQNPNGADTNTAFNVYDAYFNGTYTMTLEPPSTQPNCPKLSSQRLYDQYLRIGPQSRESRSRAKYDKNPFFLSFGSTINGTRCAYAANKAFVGFTSSDDNLKYSQPWSLSAPEKKGNSFALAGKLSQTQASNGNFFFYTVNTTGSDSSYSESCNVQFTQHSLTSRDGASMTAEVSRDTAVMRFQFVDALTGYTVKGEFNGAAWTDGPRLNTDGTNIVTEGQIQLPKTEEELKKDTKKLLKTILISVAGGVGVLILLSIGCCCWCRRRRRRIALKQ